MMKILGAAFIFAGCLYIGFIRARAYNMREKSLGALKDCLFHIRSSIEFRNDALPELFSRLSGQDAGQAGAFFKKLSFCMDKIGETSFASIWSDAVKTCFKELSDPEYAELSKLGQVIGRCDAATQIKALADSEAFFGKALEALRHELPQKRRLALGLSATAGAFAVILLI